MEASVRSLRAGRCTASTNSAAAANLTSSGGRKSASRSPSNSAEQIAPGALSAHAESKPTNTAGLAEVYCGRQILTPPIPSVEASRASRRNHAKVLRGIAAMAILAKSQNSPFSTLSIKFLDRFDIDC
jgi:hypothetical protein